MNSNTITAAALALVLASPIGFAQEAPAQEGDSFEGATRDAWITGKIEAVYTLNRHLSPFSIDTDVESGVVHLTGTVESEIDRDLAGELARGIEGVVEVENGLQVEQGARELRADEAAEGERDFGAWVDDATTTAAVKSKLIGNDHVSGLEIDVDTNHNVVTLSGSVGSDEERDLAGELAANTSGVTDVRNNLVVDPS